MQRLFFLRAYGDFVIGLQAIGQSKKPIWIVASLHLKPLYDALLKAQLIPPFVQDQIEFIDFGINLGQLRFFTNKQLLSLATFKQLKAIQHYIQYHPNPNGQDYIEHTIRLSWFRLFTKSTCKAVVGSQENVYHAYAAWLGNTVLNSTDSVMYWNENTHYGNVLLLPDARMVQKEITPATIRSIQIDWKSKGVHLQIARFNNPNTTELRYTNFEELIKLIQSADFIITADSLPAHIAQALNKPHRIVYNLKKPNRFCTPFVLSNQSFDCIHA